MKPRAFITTSWDDGHPLDIRVAELLSEYGLRGTFYIPRATKSTATLAPAQVRELSGTFEVGGHTLQHTILTRVDAARARREIVGCKDWLEDLTGRPCPMFCPPKGKFTSTHLELIREAGFSGVRTVELLSIDFPHTQRGLLMMPTTLQAHSHDLSGYARNLARRAAFGNFWRFIVHGRSTDWPKLADSLAHRVIARGGVFHLWGHSWELEENDQWRRLESVLELLGRLSAQAPALTNSEVCQVGPTAPAASAVTFSIGG